MSKTGVYTGLKLFFYINVLPLLLPLTAITEWDRSALLLVREEQRFAECLPSYSAVSLNAKLSHCQLQLVLQLKNKKILLVSLFRGLFQSYGS